MGNGERRGPDEGAGSRRVTYCLVPHELAARLHEPLRRHFAEDPAVEVIVEQRGRERRSAPERRQAEGDPPDSERRSIRNPAGRRVGERRAVVELLSGDELPELPRRARRDASRLRFVRRLEPAGQEQEDRDSARLVIRFQSGDPSVFPVLYHRYFDRVYGYLRSALRDAHEAEDLTQQVFMRVFEALHHYERRRQPFRAWLFVVVRNVAIDHIRHTRAIDVEDAEQLNRRRERSEAAEPDPDVLNWISDRDLRLFVDRLPDAQRQVLMLRYMLDLSTDDIARILGRTPDNVRMLQHRGLRFLKARLSALGRAPKQSFGHRSRSRRQRPRLTVVRARRWALVK